MKIEIITSIENNIFKRNRNLVLNAIKYFNDKEVVISFSNLKRSRSNSQNKFYWGVVIPLIQNGLLEATGELRSSDNIHYKILLPLFSPINEIVNKNTGEIINEKLTSSDLTTTQFQIYFLEIQKWAAEFLNIDIPNPNEENLINFTND
jgi:hypothetical protein